jgi:hypothetical protein
MEGSITAKSKNGNGLLIGTVWYNQDKKSGVSFSKVSRGDSVKFEINDGTTFITKIEVTGSGEASGSGEKSKAPSPAPQADNGPYRLETARAQALIAVMSNAVLAEQLKTKDMSEALSEYKGLAEELAKFIIGKPVEGKA